MKKQYNIRLTISIISRNLTARSAAFLITRDKKRTREYTGTKNSSQRDEKFFGKHVYKLIT